MIYNMRTLEAGDIFPFVSIVSKIGLKDIAKCLGKDRLTKIVESVNKGKNKGKDESTSESVTDDVLNDIGLDVALEILDVVLNSIGKCRDELFVFLASICKVDVADIEHQPLDDFMNQLLAFIRKKELMSFISVASKFIK